MSASSKHKYKFNNREISWLQFNERLLQEAEDKSVPLIERIKFLGIYSNNLDEFFRVRVATLNRFAQLKSKDEKIQVQQTRKLLKKIKELDLQQQSRFDQIFSSLVEELSQHQIHIVNERQLTETQGQFVRDYFRQQVRPSLFPVMLDDNRANVTLKDKSIYLGIIMEKKEKTEKSLMAVIKIPTFKLSRFVILPEDSERKYIMMLDDVIRYNLREVFSIFTFNAISAYTFKITRDAELDIDSDVSKSFLEIMSESLKKRTSGSPVRFLIDREMPEIMIATLKKKLKMTSNDSVIAGRRYHNFRDFMRFPNVGSPDLEYKPIQPLPHPALVQGMSLFEAIRKKDLMLHFPYQSFQYIIDLLREASIDPQVRSIRITLYRLAIESNVINALINAARNGKSVTVFMEVQARFDEEANIQYTEMLQEEGVRIIQAIPGFKVHGKLILIRRKEKGNNVYYANISTGNFNETTAMLYADDSLLTADPVITQDVLKVFELFESNYKQQKFRSLIVSPFKMRDHFSSLLKREIKNKRAGKEAWVKIKLNNLVDEKMAQLIYEAATEGVDIIVQVRGACILLATENQVEEHLQVFGIIDHYLEHSRVFIFCNDGDPLYYISSADWMIRNFDNRIEVAAPILDPEIQMELKTIMDFQMQDNTKARRVGLKEGNTYRTGGQKKKVRSQLALYEYFRKKLNAFHS